MNNQIILEFVDTLLDAGPILKGPMVGKVKDDEIAGDFAISLWLFRSLLAFFGLNEIAHSTKATRQTKIVELGLDSEICRRLSILLLQKGITREQLLEVNPQSKCWNSLKKELVSRVLQDGELWYFFSVCKDGIKYSNGKSQILVVCEKDAPHAKLICGKEMAETTGRKFLSSKLPIHYSELKLLENYPVKVEKLDDWFYISSSEIRKKVRFVQDSKTTFEIEMPLRIRTELKAIIRHAIVNSTAVKIKSDQHTFVGELHNVRQRFHQGQINTDELATIIDNLILTKLTKVSKMQKTEKKTPSHDPKKPKEKVEPRVKKVAPKKKKVSPPEEVPKFVDYPGLSPRQIVDRLVELDLALGAFVAEEAQILIPEFDAVQDELARGECTRDYPTGALAWKISPGGEYTMKTCGPDYSSVPPDSRYFNGFRLVRPDDVVVQIKNYKLRIDIVPQGGVSAAQLGTIERLAEEHSVEIVNSNEKAAAVTLPQG